MKNLIFIYNAKSDGISKAFDFVHKIISPATYSCDLCKLTHDNFGERKIWIDFMENTQVEMTFYYKDEFEKAFKNSFKYPVVLTKNEGELSEFISSDEISKIDSVEKLMKLITAKL